MKQISTGTGLCVLGLGVAVLGAAQLVGSKGGQAFAQTGSERRIVNVGMNEGGMAYRVWSDGVIETRCVGRLYNVGIDPNTQANQGINYILSPDGFGGDINASIWKVVENGQTPTVQPSDTNTDGSVDAADLGKVLLDYGATQEVTPVPTIDCQTSTIP